MANLLTSLRRRVHRRRVKLEIRSAANGGDLPALIGWAEGRALRVDPFNDTYDELRRSRAAAAELVADELRAVGLEATLAAALSMPTDRPVGPHLSVGRDDPVRVVVRTFASDSIARNAELLASVMSRIAPTDAEEVLERVLFDLDERFVGSLVDNSLAQAIERLQERVGEDAPLVVDMRKRLAWRPEARRGWLAYEAWVWEQKEARKALLADKHYWEERLYRDQHKRTIAGNIKVLETSMVFGDGRKEYYEAVRQLGEAGPRAVLPLIRLLETGSTEARAGAAQALGEIGDPRAIPALEAHVHDRGEYDESAYQSIGEYRHVCDRVLAALTSIKNANAVKPARKPAAKPAPAAWPPASPPRRRARPASKR